MNSTTINCILFVVITYLLTCIIAWSSPSLYVTLIATFIPASVAILLTVYNKQRVRDLFKFSSLKNCLLGFVIILVARVIVIPLGTLVFTFVQAEEYAYTLEKVKDFSIAMILLNLLLTFVILIVTSLGEEIGWRGYLLKNLKNQIPNFYARAIVVGLIWAVWHIPIYTTPGSAEASIFWRDGFTFPIICTYILAVCATSIVFTWLFEKDNSVWPVTIAHATNNFMAGTVPFLFTTMSFPIPTSTAMISQIFVAIGYFIVAMGVIWFDKTRGCRLSDS